MDWISNTTYTYWWITKNHTTGHWFCYLVITGSMSGVQLLFLRYAALRAIKRQVPSFPNSLSFGLLTHWHNAEMSPCNYDFVYCLWLWRPVSVNCSPDYSFVDKDFKSCGWLTKVPLYNIYVIMYSFGVVIFKFLFKCTLVTIHPFGGNRVYSDLVGFTNDFYPSDLCPKLPRVYRPWAQCPRPAVDA